MDGIFVTIVTLDGISVTHRDVGWTLCDHRDVGWNLCAILTTRENNRYRVNSERNATRVLVPSLFLARRESLWLLRTTVLPTELLATLAATDVSCCCS